MNLLLLEPDEVAAGGTVLVRGARAEHLQRVQRVQPGVVLQAGIVDGPIGRAEVLTVGTAQIELRCAFAAEPPPRPCDVLLLAIARPRVLARCLAAAAALGYGRILLFRSWRVDKSHLGARELEPARTRAHLLAGLSQARRTRLPQLLSFPRFRPFVEDELDALATPAQRHVADPDAGTDVAMLHLVAAQPITLAVGPERGFTEFEVQLLATRGFTPVRIGEHPLRVETALAAMTGALRARVVGHAG